MSKFNQAKIAKLKTIDSLLKSIYFFPKNVKKYQAVNKSEIREILLIGIWLIGDTIMHLPIINIIKKNYPNARITVICEKQSEIILKDQDLVDDFIIIKCPWVVPFNYSIKSLFKFFSSAFKVNKKRYDLAFEFRGDWRSIFYMNFLNSTRKISYDYSGGKYMLTDPIRPDKSIENISQESLYLLKQFGCTFTGDEATPRLKLTKEDADYLTNFRLAHNLTNQLIIGVHPGTTQKVKRWDENNYSNLIIRLSETYPNSVFILFEGPNERDTVSAIQTQLNNAAVNYLVINKSLKEYIKLISLCQIMICNDSGAGHIAGAYQIPVIVIFGSRGPEFVYPYGSKQQDMISLDLECKPCYQTECKFRSILCLTGIKVEDVYIRTCKIINLLRPSQEITYDR